MFLCYYKIMDKEALEIAKAYSELRERHFNGGYFSDEVQAEFERVAHLNEEEKEQLFTDLFNETWKLGKELQSSATFNKENYEGDEGSLDLNRNLGSIHISLPELEKEDTSEGTLGAKGIMIYSESFDPTPKKEMVWPNNPHDPLGLESVREQVQLEQPPQHMEEWIWADPDGTFRHEANGPTLDQGILQLLDARETLQVAQQHPTEVPA